MNLLGWLSSSGGQIVAFLVGGGLVALLGSLLRRFTAAPKTTTAELVEHDRKVEAVHVLEAKSEARDDELAKKTAEAKERVVAKVETERASPPPTPHDQDLEADALLEDARRRWDDAKR